MTTLRDSNTTCRHMRTRYPEIWTTKSLSFSLTLGTNYRWFQPTYEFPFIKGKRSGPFWFTFSTTLSM